MILPPMHEVDAEGYLREPSSGPLTFSRFLEGTFGVSSWTGSTSSRSDGSDSELISKTHGPSNCNFSNRRCFMSKPVHPLTFPDQAAAGNESYCFIGSSNSNSSHSDYKSNQAISELQSLGFVKTSMHRHQESVQWSSTSSVDFIDFSGTLESETVGLPRTTKLEGSKCELCDRLLSQRSPWGSRRIVHGGDMPIVSVLSCWHVYHAECLERTIPKAYEHDPPCPVCGKPDGNSSEQWAVCKLKSELTRVRSTSGEGSSRVWSCAKVGDCVEGALHAPKQSRMMLLNRSRLKRQLSVKGDQVKEQAESSKKGGFCSSDVLSGSVGGQHAVGCSSMASSPGLKRW